MSVGGEFNHGCDTCAKACVDCKTNVVSLEKKNFKMAIALTSALTLLGEQGVKAVIGMIESMNSITDAADAPDGKDATASSGSSYQFGPGKNRLPTFSGYRPPWNPAAGGTGEDAEVPASDWGMARGAGTELSTYRLPAQQMSNVNSWTALAWNEPEQTSSNQISSGELLSPQYLVAADLSIPSPFGGSGDEWVCRTPTGWTVPPPSSLYVFAFGGLFGSRSRA